MTDKEKLDKLVAEIERLYHQSLVDEKRQAEWGLSSAACTSYGKSKVCKELLSFIDSMQKKPASEDLWKENKIKILADIIFNAAKHGYMPYDTQNEYCAMEIAKRYIDKFIATKNQENPVSEDLEQAIDIYLATYFGGEKEKQYWPFLKKMAIHFANWQKQQMETYRIKHCKSITNEQYELEETFVSSHVEKNNRIPTFIDAIEYGIEYGKQQMMAKAVDAVVKVDAGGYPYIDRTIELYDYDKDIPLAKKGDKYKLILIKED